MMKPRPSSMPMLQACARWVNRPKAEDDKKDDLDIAADEGTLIHATLEALAERPVVNWDDAIDNDFQLPDDLKSVVRDASLQVRDIFSQGLPVVTKRILGLDSEAHYEIDDILWEDGKPVYAPPAGRPSCRRIMDAIYCEVGLDSGVCLPGTADLVGILGTHAWLVDYKSNRVVRSHDAQQEAYIVALFKTLPELQSAEQRIVAPRLGNAHAPAMFSRDMIGSVSAGLQHIVDRADDPFNPGEPGEQCAFCAGNGRCPYQAASLKDIIEPEGALIPAGAWRALMDPNITPEQRGWRRGIAKQMDMYSDAIKDDDKAWAEQNPGVMPTGWTVSLARGRLSVDKERLAELNEKIRLTFGLTYEIMESFSVPDRKRIAEYVSMARGMSADDVSKDMDKAIAGFMKRGADTVRFTQEKIKKQISS